jgi:hypothetical protein
MNEYNDNNKSPLSLGHALVILGCIYAFCAMGGCATAQGQTEVANLRFLVQELDNLGDSVDGLFGQ